MTEALFLTRAKMKPLSSIGPLLGPSLRDGALTSGHRLLWTLFSDDAERKRDFLWRDTGGGGYIMLSRRKPMDHHNIFDLDEPRPFAPNLDPGQRLGFLLRANATVTRKLKDGPERQESTKLRRKHDDVVMAALSAIPAGPARAEARAEVEERAAIDWLKGQGGRAGFSILGLSGLSYETATIPHGKAKIKLGILDLEGTMIVEHPNTFLAAIAQGFGRSKAFGCGLMLIRRDV
ncbi:MAG: hypothetical protein RL186_1156 [Pseudomonadota bacterium]